MGLMLLQSLPGVNDAQSIGMQCKTSQDLPISTSLVRSSCQVRRAHPLLDPALPCHHCGHHPLSWWSWLPSTHLCLPPTPHPVPLSHQHHSTPPTCHCHTLALAHHQILTHPMRTHCCHCQIHQQDILVVLSCPRHDQAKLN